MRYALLSVYDKTGIVEFAKELTDLKFEIISTGGTAKILEQAGIKVIPIQEVTKNPESFDGRMKTISFQIESGILFDRKNPKHVKEAKELNIKPVDLVVCNLYPFEQTVGDKKSSYDDIIESIDVGGPTMIRAAGKNHKNVIVVTDPRDYMQVVSVLKTGTDDQRFRKALAGKAFRHLSFYDALVANFLDPEEYPQELTIPGRRKSKLRYGENPHQKEAYFYQEPNNNSPLSMLEKITGQDMSYVNLTDVWSGIESVRVFTQPAAVIIKHNNPCGIALGKDSSEALKRAVEADPVSAFGGVAVLNSPIDLKTAKVFAGFKEEKGVQMDIIATPQISKDAREFIGTIRKKTGIYTFGKIPKTRSNKKHIKFTDGGFIIQDWDDNPKNWYKDLVQMGKYKATKKQLEQMLIAWEFINRIKSNTIIVVDKNLPMTRGIGSGQTSRVGSAKIALEQAGKYNVGAIMASDSFFPFDDCVKMAAKVKIGAIIQQGGSINDKASIEAADKAGIPVYKTQRRAFWH